MAIMRHLRTPAVATHDKSASFPIRVSASGPFVGPPVICYNSDLVRFANLNVDGFLSGGKKVLILYQFAQWRTSSTSSQTGEEVQDNGSGFPRYHAIKHKVK